MKMSKFAEKFEMDEDEMIELLTDNGYLKKNGDPTKKGEDYLDDDENVTDSRGLQKIVGDILDDDEDSDDSNEDDDEDSDEDEDNDDEDEEIDYETIKNTIEDFEFSKDEKVDLAKLLIDKLAEDTDADDDEDEEDSDEDDEDEDDDPNAPGTYKGWKISREGIKIIAKNGKKSLTTSVKGGNIRKIIDSEMKKKK